MNTLQTRASEVNHGSLGTLLESVWRWGWNPCSTTQVGPSRHGWKTLERDLWARAGLDVKAGVLVRAPSEPRGWELLPGSRSWTLEERVLTLHGQDCCGTASFIAESGAGNKDLSLPRRDLSALELRKAFRSYAEGDSGLFAGYRVGGDEERNRPLPGVGARQGLTLPFTTLSSFFSSPNLPSLKLS